MRDGVEGGGGSSLILTVLPGVESLDETRETRQSLKKKSLNTSCP